MIERMKGGRRSGATGFQLLKTAVGHALVVACSGLNGWKGLS
jgi:hypothetical protein